VGLIFFPNRVAQSVAQYRPKHPKMAILTLVTY